MENKEYKPTLYGLTVEYQDLYNQLLDSVDEDGVVDIAISQALEKKELEFNEKAVAVANVYMKFDDELDLVKKRIKALEEYKDKLEKLKKRLGDSLTDACERTGTMKIDNVYARISFRSSEQTIVDDEKLLPQEYFTETITRKPNLIKIKEDIKKGKEVQGAYIKKKNNIHID